MGMLLLFSRRVVPPCSWVSGNAAIGLLCCECYMSSHYLSSVKENICSLTNQGSPFPFLSSLAHWIFKALTFGTFYFQSRERQGDELSFLIKSLQYFYITEWLCLVCAIFIPGEKKKKKVEKSFPSSKRENNSDHIIMNNKFFFYNVINSSEPGFVLGRCFHNYGAGGDRSRLLNWPNKRGLKIK